MNWRRIVEHLAGSAESPRRTAAAFALGTFLSFSPFVGLQIVTGFGLAFLLRLNRIAVFIGLNTNLPWLIVPWYSLTTIIGSLLLGRPIAEDFGAKVSSLLELPVYRAVFWQRAYELLAPFFWSFLVGSTLCAAVIGVIAYAVTVPILTRMKARRDITEDPPPTLG
jgi:uncharacterized protein